MEWKWGKHEEEEWELWCLFAKWSGGKQHNNMSGSRAFEPLSITWRGKKDGDRWRRHHLPSRNDLQIVSLPSPFLPPSLFHNFHQWEGKETAWGEREEKVIWGRDRTRVEELEWKNLPLFFLKKTILSTLDFDASQRMSMCGKKAKCVSVFKYRLSRELISLRIDVFFLSLSQRLLFALEPFHSFPFTRWKFSSWWVSFSRSTFGRWTSNRSQKRDFERSSGLLVRHLVFLRSHSVPRIHVRNVLFLHNYSTSRYDWFFLFVGTQHVEAGVIIRFRICFFSFLSPRSLQLDSVTRYIIRLSMSSSSPHHLLDFLFEL